MEKINGPLAVYKNLTKNALIPYPKNVFWRLLRKTHKKIARLHLLNLKPPSHGINAKQRR